MTRLVLFELFVTNLLLLSTNEKTKKQKCSLDFFIYFLLIFFGPYSVNKYGSG